MILFHTSTLFTKKSVHTIVVIQKYSCKRLKTIFYLIHSASPHRTDDEAAAIEGHGIRSYKSDYPIHWYLEFFALDFFLLLLLLQL